MKNQQHRFDTAIKFINFHRFLLSIDKNHLIAIDFYRYRFLSIDCSGYDLRVMPCSREPFSNLLDVTWKSVLLGNLKSGRPRWRMWLGHRPVFSSDKCAERWLSNKEWHRHYFWLWLFRDIHTFHTLVYLKDLCLQRRLHKFCWYSSLQPPVVDNHVCRNSHSVSALFGSIHRFYDMAKPPSSTGSFSVSSAGKLAVHKPRSALSWFREHGEKVRKTFSNPDGQ